MITRVVNPYWFQCGPIRMRIQGFELMTKNCKIIQLKKSSFSDRKLLFIYPLASMQDVQARGETSSLQKRTSSTSKHEISLLFFLIRIHIPNADPEQDPAGQKSMWIHTEPDPQD
jgi:hypothetical protein